MISWKIHENQLPQSICRQWDLLTLKDSHTCASSTRYFTENLLPLIDADKTFYVLGYINKQLFCVIPLILKKQKVDFFTINLLQLITHDQLDLFRAVGQHLVSDKQLISSLQNYLKKQTFCWTCFSGKNWLFHEDLACKSVYISKNQQSAFFDLQNAREISDIVSSKMLRNLDRLQKKMNQSKGEACLIQFDGWSQIEQGLQQFYQIEASGWKGKEGSTLEANAKLKQFYTLTWKQLGNQQMAKVFVLQSGNQAIAAALAFQHAGKIYLHKICYHEAYREYSPGGLLIKNILTYAIEDKTLEKVFLNTDPLWAQRWHPQKAQLTSIFFFNNGAKARLLNFLYWGYFNLKKIIFWFTYDK